jgi:hypothetical protein
VDNQTKDHKGDLAEEIKSEKVNTAKQRKTVHRYKMWVYRRMQTNRKSSTTRSGILDKTST